MVCVGVCCVVLRVWFGVHCLVTVCKICVDWCCIGVVWFGAVRRSGAACCVMMWCGACCGWMYVCDVLVCVLCVV